MASNSQENTVQEIYPKLNHQQDIEKMQESITKNGLGEIFIGNLVRTDRETEFGDKRLGMWKDGDSSAQRRERDHKPPDYPGMARCSSEDSLLSQNSISSSVIRSEELEKE